MKTNTALLLVAVLAMGATFVVVVPHMFFWDPCELVSQVNEF
jgi:hypothetical protein